MKKIITLLCAIILYAEVSFCQTPAITMTTNITFGNNIQFGVQASADNTVIQVDFGDGKLINETIGKTFKALYSPLVVSHTVKIYGSGITVFDCSAQQLTSLDISNDIELTILFCTSNKLTFLNIYKNTALTRFSCQDNLLTSLDVSKNTALTELICTQNNLNTLDISKNLGLVSLSCYFNQLTSIDVSKNKVLVELYCSFNQLTKIKLTPSLKTLYCDDNQLNNIDISNNDSIVVIYCFNNNLTFNTLPLKQASLFYYNYAPQNAIPINNLIGIGVQVDLNNQLTLNGFTTTYNWKNKSGAKLLPGVDYTLNNGITVFLKQPSDSVYCEMTNGNFPDLSGVNILKTTLTKIVPAATITSFTPTTGTIGSSISITGTNFIGVTDVKFGGIPAASFTINSATSITATVAAGASGNVGITIPGSTATMAGFTFKLNQTINFGAISPQEYGNTDFAPDAVATSSLLVKYSSSNTSVATIVSDKIHIIGIGACTIYANQAGDGTYNAAPQASQNLSISPREITIKANPGQSKKPGNADPVLSYTITSGTFANSETLTGALSRASGEMVGIYPIQLSTLTAGNNYNITFITDNFTIVLGTGISNISLNKPGIYPNPTNGLITVDTPEGIVSITDIEGKMLLKCSLDASKTIDISNYATGVYFLVLKTEHSIYEYKVIKK